MFDIYKKDYVKDVKTGLLGNENTGPVDNTYFGIKDLSGSVLVRTKDGRKGFKPKSEEEMTI